MWNVVQDVVRWPEWTPTILRVVPLGRRELAIGNRYRIQQPGMPPLDWTVTRLEAGSSFSWSTTSFGMRVDAHHALTSAPDGTRVHLQLDFLKPAGMLIALFTRARNRRYLCMEALALKGRCEWPLPQPGPVDAHPACTRP